MIDLSARFSDGRFRTRILALGVAAYQAACLAKLGDDLIGKID